MRKMYFFVSLANHCQVEKDLVFFLNKFYNRATGYQNQVLTQNINNMFIRLKHFLRMGQRIGVDLPISAKFFCACFENIIIVRSHMFRGHVRVGQCCPSGGHTFSA